MLFCQINYYCPESFCIECNSVVKCGVSPGEVMPESANDPSFLLLIFLAYATQGGEAGSIVFQ
jgi:hypothetical protein